MKRKVISILLALVLCVSLAVPVLAAEKMTDTHVYFGEITIHSVVKTSTISVEYWGGTKTETLYWLPAEGSEVSVENAVLRSDEEKATEAAPYGFMLYYLGNDGTYVSGGIDVPADFVMLSDGSVGFNAIDSQKKWLLNYLISVGELDENTSMHGGNVIFTQGGIYFALMDEETTPSEQPSSWAVPQVNAAIAAGLVPSALQSKYTDATTRAEFCALAVALYENVVGEITGRSTFTDTSDVNVQKAAYICVVNGVGDGRFAPGNKLTREQAATMLSRLADAIGKPLAKQAATFNDKASVSSWAIDAVGQMQATGIMTGVGNNTFAPASDYTREQSIVTIMRLYDVVK